MASSIYSDVTETKKTDQWQWLEIDKESEGVAGCWRSWWKPSGLNIITQQKAQSRPTFDLPAAARAQNAQKTILMNNYTFGQQNVRALWMLKWGYKGLIDPFTWG